MWLGALLRATETGTGRDTGERPDQDDQPEYGNVPRGRRDRDRRDQVGSGEDLQAQEQHGAEGLTQRLVPAPAAAGAPRQTRDHDRADEAASRGSRPLSIR